VRLAQLEVAVLGAPEVQEEDDPDVLFVDVGRTRWRGDREREENRCDLVSNGLDDFLET
jgi:hypothetical protein